MLDHLTREYAITFNGVLAQRLGVSVKSIQRKASELGLVKAGTGKTTRHGKLWNGFSLLTVRDRLPKLQGFLNGLSGAYASL